MIACISPLDRDYEENISTLNYAALTSHIKNDPVVVGYKKKVTLDIHKVLSPTDI